MKSSTTTEDDKKSVSNRALSERGSRRSYERQYCLPVISNVSRGGDKGRKHGKRVAARRTFCRSMLHARQLVAHECALFEQVIEEGVACGYRRGIRSDFMLYAQPFGLEPLPDRLPCVLYVTCRFHCWHLR
jgi:hypothetical protein